MFEKVTRGASLRRTYLSKRAEERNKREIMKSYGEFQTRNVNARS